MKPVIGLLLFIVTSAYFCSCEIKDEATRAAVVTENVTILNPNNAIVTGKVLDNGGGGDMGTGSDVVGEGSTILHMASRRL